MKWKTVINVLMPRPALLALVAAIAMLATATAAQISAMPAQEQVSTESDGAGNKAVSNAGTIATGDLIEVTVFGATDFDRQIRVLSNGTVVLPFIGEVKVGGLSTYQAEALVAKKLAAGDYFNNPHVSVVIKESTTQGISVLGEVNRPGIYQMAGNRTLLDALSAAGGVTAKSGTFATITHREGPNSPERIPLPNSAGDSGKNNIPLRPGDVIQVSKAGMVYVVGDVRQPTGIVLENPKLTVLQAIAMAQGTNSTASLDKTKVIRVDGAKRQEIAIPLKKILAAKSPDVPLNSGDIIFVPSSAAKSAGRRGLEAALQTATGIAIYRHP